MNAYYLYWVYNPATKLTKIGITENHKRRIEQIECACGCEVICIGLIESFFVNNIESLCLSVLSEYKTKGDWFSLNSKIPEMKWLRSLFMHENNFVIKKAIFKHNAFMEQYHEKNEKMFLFGLKYDNEELNCF
jgi:hypothetical protein